MERADRSTLKGYFKKGCIPTEEQFAELIDSVPNIVEDGQVKLADGSWNFFPEEGKPLRIALSDAEGKPAVWTISVSGKKELVLRNGKGEIVLALDQRGKETRAEDPESDEPEGEYFIFPADKKWHDVKKILPKNAVFGAYQIFACVPVYGRIRMKQTNVTAYHYGVMSCSMKSSRKHWWGWCGKVKLRWYYSDHVLRLQVRSKKRKETGAIHLRLI